jgi:hypothetical protein
MMPSSHAPPAPCNWFSVLAAVLDPRSAPRLAWLLVGAILARGRRTVTSWIRAGGLSAEYRRCYTAVSAAGKRADSIAARLTHAVVKLLVTAADRLTLALDDTPTERYGRHVQGVGVHHDPVGGRGDLLGGITSAPAPPAQDDLPAEHDGAQGRPGEQEGGDGPGGLGDESAGGREAGPVPRPAAGHP